MKISITGNVACAVGVFVLFFSTSGRSADETPKSERFMNPITAAMKWFSNIQEYYRKAQIEPAAKEQAIRYLKKLNNSLSNVEISKQEFTDALRTARFPGDTNALDQKASGLRDSVWELRKRIRDYTQFLPADFQSSANQINTDLSNGLAEKCADLRDLSEQLTGQGDVNRDQLVELSKKTVKEIQQLEAKVSELIQELSSSAKPG